MPFEMLDPEAQKNYAAVNIRLGLPPDFSSHQGGLESGGDGPLVLSSDPLESHITPKVISVASIAQMNEMFGIPDDYPDDHIEGPPSLTESLRNHLSNSKSTHELWNGLTETDVSNIRKAATVFVLGNSERVKEYQPLIDPLFFPTNVAYFASPEPFIIKDKILVTGKTPVVWNYDKIIMEPGGSIVSEAEDFKINCNNFTTSPQPKDGYEATDPGTDLVIKISVAGYTKAAPDGPDAAKQGPPGTQGANGVEFQNIVGPNCPWTCDPQPKDGNQGGPGGAGSPGSPGGRGQNQGTFTMTVKQAITGHLIIIAGGGNGQDGGKGGKGGDGGPGGPAGDFGVHEKCTKANQGPQGPGGKGAQGGKAGDGGDGNVVTIYCTTRPGGVDPRYVGGLPGDPGIGGTGGAGNPPGGSDGNGGPGTTGKASNITFKQLG